VSHTVTLECAGNGRARLLPRPVSQPWLDEAVGTAEWAGCPLAALLAGAGVRDGAVDVASRHHGAAYRLRASADEPGVPVSLIQPRALVPPGFPDFMTWRRVVDTSGGAALRPGVVRAGSGHPASS
jgi:hypothetical protein